MFFFSHNLGPISYISAYSRIGIICYSCSHVMSYNFSQKLFKTVLFETYDVQLLPSWIFPLHCANCANSVQAIGRLTNGPVPQFRSPALL